MIKEKSKLEVDAEKFTKTALKELRRMTKDSLVNMVVQLSNYAEKQKTANILLSGAIESLKKERSQELEAQERDEK